jgi:hypothetical protein
VLRGKNSFGLVLDAAYYINDYLKVGARYYWSGTNTVETQANSYNFIPFKNTNTMWELSLAFSIESMF